MKPCLFLIFFIFLFSLNLSAKTPTKKGPIKKIAPLIVIDPGHGGHDPGAISKQGIQEKKLVLAISKKLSSILKNKLKVRVLMTRSRDEFITLENRDRLANKNRCDLFLSVHANSAVNAKAEGIEIYYLNKASDRASQKLAARENQGAPRNEKEISAILSDLIQTAATLESAELSRRVESRMRQRLRKKQGIESFKTKTALFYVLVGAKCPSLLIETGFITNPHEAKHLKQAAYQKQVAEAIAEGVGDYLKSLEKPAGDL